ncbi:MAG: ABC transporter permease [bacterium]|nr:ABC transporter permease [bacterium]
MATLRNAWADWRKSLVGMFTQVVANPVIGREWRVRMRFGRAYLLQAAYLLFMILITALAYEWVMGDLQSLANPYTVQQALLSFYWTVMGTLVSLIALIAPALTANAITLERERKTIDLLLATPLTARHLLTGKLIGSFGFIVLLLALTLPISAVSVLLGGVSFGDLLRAYVIIASGGLALCAIALFSSVYARNSTMAVLWSYARVGLFLLATGILLAIQGIYSGMSSSGSGVAWRVPAALLNPFAALFAADTQVDLVHFQVPSWIMAAALCLLFTRLLLTSAARKVGLYDKDTLPSARRQLLLLAPLHGFLTLAPLMTTGGGIMAVSGEMLLVLLSTCATPILLLTGWIAPFGDDEDRSSPNDGIFRASKMLSDAPSGALPYLGLLWLLTVGAVYGAIVWTGTTTSTTDDWWGFLHTMSLYFGGLCLLLWGIGRASSRIMKGKSLVGARVLTLATTTGVVTVPMVLHLLLFGRESESPMMRIWLLKPLFDALSAPTDTLTHFNLLYAAIWMGAIGLVMGLFTRPEASSFS